MPLHNNNPTKLSLCNVSSFSAENTMITIIPAFSFSTDLPLISSPSQQSVGPFVAGMPTKVPLWMAKMLSQRQLAQIQLPDWLTAHTLSDLLQEEKESTVLTTKLPFYYYEIARSLLQTSSGGGGIGGGGTGGTGSSGMEKSIPILLQDLVAVRIDKIRQHFHDLSRGDLSQGEMHMITVTGMCSVELNKIGPFLQQAFTDYGYLIRKAQDDDDANDVNGAAGGTSSAEKALQESQQALAGSKVNRLRRFQAEPTAY